MRYMLSLINGKLIVALIAITCCFSLGSCSKIAQKVKAKRAERKAQNAIEIAAAKPVPEPIINFYGKGEIQKSLDAGDEIPANTGLGVSYMQWYRRDSLLFNFIDKLELETSINVASTVDTIDAKYYSASNNTVINSSSFGSSILTPLNSGQAVRMSLRLNFTRDWPANIISGVKVKYVGSNRNWKVRDSVGNDRTLQASVNAFRIGVFHEFLKKNLLMNDMSINLSVYFAYNSLRGDVGLNSNKLVREEVLKTDRKRFYGPEVSVEVRLKNLRAEFSYSMLSPDKSEVPGLTGGRLVTTIAFVGGFGLKLK